MNRLLKAAAALCLLAVPAFASNTTYTATVTDTDGQAWLNGTWNAVLTLPSGPFGNVKPTVGGSAVPVSARGVLDLNGLMTVNVTNPQSLDQTGGVWLITVCPNSSVSQVADTGCVTVPIKDAGGDITARFTGLKAPRFPAGENAFGYSDIEVLQPALPGVQYFNTGNVTATQGLRVWDGKVWTGVGAGSGGGGAPPAGADTEYQSRTSSTAFGRTGVYTDDPLNPTLSNTKVPQGLYTYNSAKTNSQFGSGETYHRFHLCAQDAVVPNSVGTSACDQEFSTFYAPGNNSGGDGGAGSNGNFGWSVSKLQERYFLVQTPGISQVASDFNFCFKTGDCSNHYGYLYNFGGWDDRGGEGQVTQTLQAINNINMYQAVAQTTQTGTSTFVPANGWKDYALVGGYIINHDRPVTSGNIIGEVVTPLSGSDAFADTLQSSAAVFTPSTFQGTNPSAIDIGNPNAGSGVVRTVTLTGTGTVANGQLIIIGCRDYPVFVKPTVVTGGSGTWQITGTFYRGCAAGGEAWQGGTHGLITLPWVDKVVHEAPNAGMWQSGWLVGGASDSTHIHLYNYITGLSRGHLDNWGQDFGHTYGVFLTRASNLASLCTSGAFASQPITITGAADSSFNGSFTAGAYNNATGCIPWSNPGPDVASPVSANFNVGGAIGGSTGRGAFTIYPFAMVKQAIPTPSVSNGTTSLNFSGSLALFDNDMPITSGDHIIAMQDMANRTSAQGLVGNYFTPPTAGLQEPQYIYVNGPGVQTDQFRARSINNTNQWAFYANGGGTGHGQGATADYITGPWARNRYSQAPLPGGIVEEVDVSDAVQFGGVHGDYIDRVHRMHTGNFAYTTRFDPWLVKYSTIVANADTLKTSQSFQSGEGFAYFGHFQMFTDGSDQSGGLTGVSSDSQGHLATNAGFVPGSASAHTLYGNNSNGSTAPSMFAIPGVNTNLFYNNGGSIAADTNTGLDGNGNILLKSVTVNGTSGVGFGFLGTEGTAPSGSGGKDGFWADSTAHRLQMNNNNAGTRTVVGLATPGTNGHIVRFDTNGIDLVDGGAAGITASGSTCTITAITNGIITGASCTP